MDAATRRSASATLLSERAELLKRLLDLVRQEQSSPCIRVLSRNVHALNAVNIDEPLLVVALQGRKRVRDRGSWIDMEPGEILVVPHATAIDMENIPDPLPGCYCAVGISLDQRVLSAARQLVREPIRDDGRGITCVALDDYVQDLTSWLNALERQDLPLACHAVAGILLKLYAQGHRGLLYPPVPSLSARIRSRVTAEPAREWSSAQLEADLGMSGATLRRHLAAEGVSLRQLIGDARLSHGLSLLLSTRLPVKAVALRAGYSSVSTFVKRFSERYGVEPSRVGGQ